MTCWAPTYSETQVCTLIDLEGVPFWYGTPCMIAFTTLSPLPTAFWTAALLLEGKKNSTRHQLPSPLTALSMKAFSCLWKGYAAIHQPNNWTELCLEINGWISTPGTLLVLWRCCSPQTQQIGPFFFHSSGEKLLQLPLSAVSSELVQHFSVWQFTFWSRSTLHLATYEQPYSCTLYQLGQSAASQSQQLENFFFYHSIKLIRL